jgi:quinol monooxygenase YgiN
MSQLTNLAFFCARPGQTQALGSALSALVDPTRAETECLNYDLHQSIDDADVWFVYENWRSAVGLEAHMRAPYVQAFLKVAPDLIADDIDLRWFSMITMPAAPRA